MSFENGPNAKDNASKTSEPISIHSAYRRRSASVSSASSGSASSTSDISTPVSGSVNPSRISIPSPSTSPILSYFLAQSPTKTPATATFPFRRTFGTTPVFEEEQEVEVPASIHTRRASTAVAGRFSSQQAVNPLPDCKNERGANVLRRLSLSGGFMPAMGNKTGRSNSPPSPPPNTAVSSPVAISNSPGRSKARRSTTMGEGMRPRRSPSPMGERILKGHFDGFN